MSISAEREKEYREEFSFLEWSEEIGGGVMLGVLPNGEPGYACKDGSTISTDDPRVNRYSVEIIQALQLDHKFAADQLFSVVALGDEKFWQEITIKRPDTIDWLIGCNPAYQPTVFELKILKPAYINRKRLLSESQSQTANRDMRTITEAGIVSSLRTTNQTGGKSAVNSWTKSDSFPTPVSTGPPRTWRFVEVHQWLRDNKGLELQHPEDVQ